MSISFDDPLFFSRIDFDVSVDEHKDNKRLFSNLDNKRFFSNSTRFKTASAAQFLKYLFDVKCVYEKMFHRDKINVEGLKP